MTITAQQIADLRADIGDNGNPPAFEEPELSRIWDRLASAADDTQRHEAALGLMARQLLNNAARLHDYAAGNNEEKLDQVFKHLQTVYEMYRPAMQAALGQKKQVVMSKLRAVPRQDRAQPSDFQVGRRQRTGPSTWTDDEDGW